MSATILRFSACQDLIWRISIAQCVLLPCTGVQEDVSMMLVSADFYASAVEALLQGSAEADWLHLCLFGGLTHRREVGWVGEENLQVHTL